MKMKEPEVPAVFLRPGEMYFGTQPSCVSTVLGSCVSIVMYNPRLAVGLISHALLPRCRREIKCSDDCTERFRYVECTIKNSARLLLKKGIQGKEIVVKIFGGSNIMPSDSRRNTLSVGEQNIREARKAIEEEGLRIAVADVGGIHGRKLFFFTHSGDVLVKRIGRSVLPREELMEAAGGNEL